MACSSTHVHHRIVKQHLSTVVLLLGVAVSGNVSSLAFAARQQSTAPTPISTKRLTIDGAKNPEQFPQ